MFEARFQTFTETADKDATPARLAALREELRLRGFDGFVVPHADRYGNEYLPPSEERLAWLTGFTGSAGSAVVLETSAAVFVDGRYTLQAQAQVDGEAFAVVHLSETTVEAWIEAQAPEGTRIGYDPWLHTPDQAEKLGKACANAKATLVPAEGNPLDAIWSGRPPAPLGPLSAHPLAYAGETSASKLARLRAEIAKTHADAAVLSNPTGVAWLFNIRGADVAHTPAPLAFAVVPAEGRPALYVDGRKLGDDALRDELAAFCDLRDEDDFGPDLARLGECGATVLFQPSGVEALSRLATEHGGIATRVADPVTQLKAIKNETEIAGARAAHRRDGAALARFLAWFDAEAPSGRLTEIDAVAALETFRRDTGHLADISFPTIAGTGPNGAIVHYRVTEASNRRIAPGELFLLDSGGQYREGTTDVTRTISVGEPAEEMRERFTRVLKGHIAIARAVFPDGVAGGQIDGFARQFLWSVGLDYDHGTGHGVGSYLSVHEGPISIHKSNLTPLKPGMIVSNEPGFYKPGAYGIRIENLVLVVEREGADADARKPLRAFETLTLAPIDRRLVLPSLMTGDEIAWLDAYHAEVARAIAPLVDDDTRRWLAGATAPIEA